MSTKEQEAISEMFDRIAKTYDATNRILSFNQDVRWRQAVARSIPYHGAISVLDIATGTADLLIAISNQCPNIKRAIGIDLSHNMLRYGQKKLLDLDLHQRITLMKADACALPFADTSFDVVSIAFGIRNIAQVDVALRECLRVLKPNGHLMILEFSLPQHPWLKTLYLFYFRHILPWIGELISQDRSAYRYLNRSVEAFPLASAFAEQVGRNGFSSVEISSLSFGIATLYRARKS